MLEGLMALSLVLMGVYFVKSTDLPKELKDRSAQMRNETQNITVNKRKMAFPAGEEKKSAAIEIKKQNNQALIDLHNKAIDELTLKITTLEQELKANNERNAEIQKMIDIHMENLNLLTSKKNALA